MNKFFVLLLIGGLAAAYMLLTQPVPLEQSVATPAAAPDAEPAVARDLGGNDEAAAEPVQPSSSPEQAGSATEAQTSTPPIERERAGALSEELPQAMPLQGVEEPTATFRPPEEAAAEQDLGTVFRDGLEPAQSPETESQASSDLSSE